MPRDTIGTDVGSALTEMRTVHSRAVSASHRLKGNWGYDVDRDEMLADIAQVIAILDKWKRTSRKRVKQ